MSVHWNHCYSEWLCKSSYNSLISQSHSHIYNKHISFISIRIRSSYDVNMRIMMEFHACIHSLHIISIAFILNSRIWCYKFICSKIINRCFYRIYIVQLKAYRHQWQNVREGKILEIFEETFPTRLFYFSLLKPKTSEIYAECYHLLLIQRQSLNKDKNENLFTRNNKSKKNSCLIP